MIAIALLGIGISLLDTLGLAPGWASKFTPLMTGAIMLFLLAERSKLDSIKIMVRGVKRVTDDLKAASRHNRKQRQGQAERKAGISADTCREIKWKGLTFRSQSEVKIAKMLDRAGVMFVSSCKVRLKTEHGRQSREVDFLIFHKGQWGVLEVDGPHHSAEADNWRDTRFQEHGIQVMRFDSNRCHNYAKEVVQEFLSSLERKPTLASDGSKEVFVVEILDTPDDVQEEG